jgi:hypothetical protein
MALPPASRELPNQADYFRPARARQLRIQAERLEWCSDHSWAVAIVAGVLLALLLGASCLWFPVGWAPWLPLVILSGYLLDRPCQRVLTRRAARCRLRAEALEAEHHERYGGLPSGF